jgi:hypothetical protein
MLFRGLVTSVLRMVGFFRVNIFQDSTWICVNLFSYAIAETGTYFLAACFSTYRPLVNRLKHAWHFSRLWDTERSADLGLPQHSGREQKEVRNGNENKEPITLPRHVKGFESILLSNISREETSDA